MSNEVWRDDTKSTEVVTTIFHATHAEDRVQVSESSPLTIMICHVRSFQGKGFMYSLRDPDGSFMRNGEIFLGTDSAAYQKALREGRIAMKEKEQEMKETSASRQTIDSPLSENQE